MFPYLLVYEQRAKEMKWRKTLIQLVLLSFSLGIYQVLFQPWWNAWLEGMGRSIGIFEVSAGFFLTGVITMVITRIVTRRME